MLSKSTIAILFFLTMLSTTDSARAQLSVFAGANFGSLSDIVIENEKTTFDTATGYHFGLTYDVNLILLVVRPGVFYRTFGDTGFEDDNPDVGSVDLAFVDIPVDVLIRVGAFPAIKPYLLAGPIFSFPTSSNEAFDGVFENFTTSISVGAGLTISLIGITLIPELRYEFGVSDMVKDTIDFDGGVGLLADSDPPSSFVARLGIGL